MLEAVGKARGTEKCDAGRNALQGEHEISLSPQAKERECSLGSPSRAPSALEPQEAAPRQPHGFTAGGFPVDMASAPSRPRPSQVRHCLEGRVPLGRLGAPHRSAAHRSVSAQAAQGRRRPARSAERTMPLALLANVALISEAAVQAGFLSTLHSFSADRRQTGCVGSLFWFALSASPEPARHSEACPRRGRGSVPLNTDVDLHSNRHHPPSCPKPPEVPVASQIQHRLLSGHCGPPQCGPSLPSQPLPLWLPQGPTQ